jgi:HSP20 family protein
MNSIITRGNLFHDFLQEVAPSYYIRPLHGDALPTPAQIKIDVKETDADYTVHAEIPGVTKEEIHVTLDGNTVTLSAEIKQEDSSIKGEKVLRSERYFGSVSRSFQLAQDIDREASKAKFENGVLTLTLDKKKVTGGTRKLAID